MLWRKGTSHAERETPSAHPLTSIGHHLPWHPAIPSASCSLYSVGGLWLVHLPTPYRCTVTAWPGVELRLSFPLPRTTCEPSHSLQPLASNPAPNTAQTCIVQSKTRRMYLLTFLPRAQGRQATRLQTRQRSPPARLPSAPGCSLARRLVLVWGRGRVSALRRDKKTQLDLAAVPCKYFTKCP